MSQEKHAKKATPENVLEDLVDILNAGASIEATERGSAQITHQGNLIGLTIQINIENNYYNQDNLPFKNSTVGITTV